MVTIYVFGSEAVRLPIEVSLAITSDSFAAGLTGTYFYIKDADGKPVEGVTLSVSGSGLNAGPQ